MYLKLNRFLVNLPIKLNSMSSPYVPLIDSSNEMPLIVRKKASPNRCKIVVFLIGLIIFVYFASSDGFWQYFEERNLKCNF